MDESATEEEAFYLEQVTLEDDEDDEFDYTEVVVEDDEDEGFGEDAAEDEDLEQALKTLKTREDGLPLVQEEAVPRTAMTRRPEVLDDFIRNVLLKMGMNETLDMFQREWYRLQGEGKLSDMDMGTVPDIYLRNQQLADQLKNMQVSIDQMKQISDKAKSTWDKFRKERDFHKMHHKRVVQEKNKLVVDLKRLKNHYANYEPMLKMMRGKYETAMKEKMLIKLERDRVVSRVSSLEAQVRQMEAGRPTDAEDSGRPQASKKPRGARLPEENLMNPYLTANIEPAPVDRWGLSKTFQGHTASVSAVAAHPSKPIIVTASDDCTWKMWSLPGGDLVMSGEGHKEWLSSVDFSPQGTHLVTGSGDKTVKIWDFAGSRCIHTLNEHTQAVWGVAYHDCGDFVVSCSMDHTAKLWDAQLGRCRQTFRGHVDSVNSICFQPYSNNICTGSGDKTVSLWDCRTGLCIQTFYGHHNAVNSVAFSMKGDMIASTDADGIVRLWDVRMVAEIASIASGPHPCNAAAFDSSGSSLAVGCDDGIVRFISTETCDIQHQMSGHNDAVQCCVFDRSGKFLVTGGSDATFRLWA